MKSQTLNTGNTIPEIGLGTWKSEAGEVYNAVLEAINIGYKHIDCAAIYGNQNEVGAAFDDIFSKKLAKREDIFITSKLWNDSHAKDDVIPALKQTLSDLKLGYLDLYLIHWPVAFKSTESFPSSDDGFISLNDLPIIETWQAMQEAVKLGLVKQIGVSNFSTKKIKDLLSKADISPAMNQVELHPYLAQNELVDYCQNNNIVVTGYSPLGAPHMGNTKDPVLLKDDTILAIAKKHGATPAQVLIKWALQRNIVSIPKSVKPQRIAENFSSLNLNLDDSDMQLIAKLDQSRRYVDGTFFNAESKGYSVDTLWD